jgi:hypothetical protein
MIRSTSLRFCQRVLITVQPTSPPSATPADEKLL